MRQWYGLMPDRTTWVCFWALGQEVVWPLLSRMCMNHEVYRHTLRYNRYGPWGKEDIVGLHVMYIYVSNAKHERFFLDVSMGCMAVAFIASQVISSGLFPVKMWLGNWVIWYDLLTF